MKSFAFILFSAWMTCMPFPLPSQEDQAERLYQEGIFQMEAMGNFAAAIELFEKLVSDFPENQLLASRALLMAGRCYEKLGREEAEKAYTRILEEYGDQQEVVSEARARLLALTDPARPAEHTGMLTRKLWQGSYGCSQLYLSEDGRKIVFIDYDANYELVIYDLETGETRPLTEDKVPGTMVFPILSPDGKWVAYSSFGESQKWGLNVLGVESGGERLILEEDEFWFTKGMKWSPDGRAIALFIVDINNQTLFGLYDLGDESFSLLLTYDEHFDPLNVSFSPDGRYLAFDHFDDTDLNWRYIYTVDLESGALNELVRHPSENFAYGWTADGEKLVFISDRTGVNAIWMLAVEDGRAAGTPELLKTDISQAMLPVSLSGSGSLYYKLESGARDVYTATFDPEATEPFGLPEKISLQFQGLNRTAVWSGDGRFIAYTASRKQKQVSLSNAVIILDTKTGREQATVPNVQQLDYVKWSPSGHSLVVHAVHVSGELRQNLLLVLDSMTGEFTDTIKGQYTEYFTDSFWLPDGKTICFLRRDYIDFDQVDFVCRNMETGEETLLFDPLESSKNLGDASPSFRLIGSSDSDKLVFSRRSAIEGQSALYLMDLNHYISEPTRLLTINAPAFINRPLSFEGDQVLFFVGSLDENNFWYDLELWSIDIVSKETNKVAAIPEGFYNLSLHPDGKTALFNMGPRMGACEIWVIENLLP